MATYQKTGYKPMQGKLKWVKPKRAGRHTCPICDNRMTEDIIKLRTDFWECRVCGFCGDECTWVDKFK